MSPSQLHDRCRGSLVGGAVGDALGYAVEFLPLSKIIDRYGPQGITGYELDSKGIAEFSDDTQMSLFTAEGLLSAMAAGRTAPDQIASSIRAAYEQWYATQTRSPYPSERSWLSHVAPLWAERAPGMTCLSALRQIAYGDGMPVENNSKGCGGVMRVAPIGIYAAAHPEALSLQQACALAGIAADITHKHPLSTYASMALAAIVAKCIEAEALDRQGFRHIVIDGALRPLSESRSGDSDMAYLCRLADKALSLADTDEPDTVCVARLGEGWVAEETLAIAIYSVARHISDFGKCIACSVNHSGDSDSTGAVAGNIIGAILGYDAIPRKYKDSLELEPLLASVADDLSGASPAEQMAQRYTRHKPCGADPALLLPS